jgi:hypothetical protein
MPSTTDLPPIDHDSRIGKNTGTSVTQTAPQLGGGELDVVMAEHGVANNAVSLTLTPRAEHIWQSLNCHVTI